MPSVEEVRLQAHVYVYGEAVSSLEEKINTVMSMFENCDVDFLCNYAYFCKEAHFELKRQLAALKDELKEELNKEEVVDEGT